MRENYNEKFILSYLPNDFSSCSNLPTAKQKDKNGKRIHGNSDGERGPFYDVTSSMLMSKNNETAAMFVSQTSPVGAELVFLRKRFPLS